MSQLLRAQPSRNQPLGTPGSGTLTLSYFNLLRLQAGESHTLDMPGCELLCVVLSGQAEIAAGGVSSGRETRIA